MKVKRLQIDGYKNVFDCDVEFAATHLINAVIGGNGSGKSNLIEAVLQVLVGFYFEKPPRFDFVLEFEANNNNVVLQRDAKGALAAVNGKRIPLNHFAQVLRDGHSQTFYPELTLVYYSGECRRVQQLVARYRRHFQKISKTPENDRLRPLFVQSSNAQSQVILLALFAHGHQQVLDHLKLDSIRDISVTLRSPDGYDPELHEPKLWNTQGNIRRIVNELNEASSSQRERRVSLPRENENSPTEVTRKRSNVREERILRFGGGSRNHLRELAVRLETAGDNLYLALESLRARGILRSVSFQLRGRNAVNAFSFDKLSEGEKQFIAVIGALTLSNQKDNFVLLDEPDTHLNPHWSWEYPSMLEATFESHQQARSSVLMATHDPVMISGMVSEQVLLAHSAADDGPMFTRPLRNPRGQGIANLLCSSEFFGLPSSLDKETQKLLDERLVISIKSKLTEHDKARLKELNQQLEIITPGVSERDPEYVAFLRQRHATTQT